MGGAFRAAEAPERPAPPPDRCAFEFRFGRCSPHGQFLVLPALTCLLRGARLHVSRPDLDGRQARQQSGGGTASRFVPPGDRGRVDQLLQRWARCMAPSFVAGSSRACPSPERLVGGRSRLRSQQNSLFRGAKGACRRRLRSFKKPTQRQFHAPKPAPRQPFSLDPLRA